jgi:hypothetical protein
MKVVFAPLDISKLNASSRANTNITGGGKSVLGKKNVGYYKN